MTTLFISDLHLDASRPAMTALFLDFLRGEARQAEALYILGDLFEAWVGDDEDSALADEVRGALRELVGHGVPVRLIRGNRDFLLGPDFAEATGVQLLADPCVIPLEGAPALLMHGDLLCSDDVGYLAFRAQVREPAWQQQFLSQPLTARRAFAERARTASREHQDGMRTDGSLETITDVNDETVVATLRRFGIDRLIHGHTHRPAVHALEVDGRRAVRVVLGDWHEHGSVLRSDGDGLALARL